MFTSEFERFVAPARRHSAIWRLIPAALLVGLFWFGSVLAVLAAASLITGPFGATGLEAEIAEGKTPRGVLLLMATFGGLFFGVMIATVVVYRRSPMSLLGPRNIAWRDFRRAAGTLLVLNGVLIIAWWPFFDPVQNLEPRTWLAVLPFAVMGLLLQTGAEELLFRGLLMQQLAARFQSAWIWMGVPTVGFGVLHYAPATAAGNAWLVVLATGVFGLIAADLTRRTGSLGAAWGLHFANNCFAILVIAIDDTLPGAALYLTPYSASDSDILPVMLIADIAALLVVWAIMIRILRR